MSNVTMVMLVRQMSDMVRQAEQMFSDLEAEIKQVETTSRRIQFKVRNLQSDVDKLDCLEEKVGKTTYHLFSSIMYIHDFQVIWIVVKEIENILAPNTLRKIICSYQELDQQL